RKCPIATTRRDHHRGRPLLQPWFPGPAALVPGTAVLRPRRASGCGRSGSSERWDARIAVLGCVYERGVLAWPEPRGRTVVAIGSFSAREVSDCDQVFGSLPSARGPVLWRRPACLDSPAGPPASPRRARGLIASRGGLGSP